MVKIRLTGTVAECEAAVDVIERTLQVEQVSRPYPNRDDPERVRVYLDVRLP